MGRTSHWRKRHWKTEVLVGLLEMLSGRNRKDDAKEAQAVAIAPAETSDMEAEVPVAM